jgi:DNA-binding response OmpR family regulator
MNIVLVEDHDDIADSSMMLLDMLGHQVTRVKTGLEAVELAKSVVPDCFIVDIGLPDIPGTEVCKRIRCQPAHYKTLMVAVSGYDISNEAKEIGFDQAFKKPVDYTRLFPAVTN